MWKFAACDVADRSSERGKEQFDKFPRRLSPTRNFAPPDDHDPVTIKSIAWISQAYWSSTPKSPLLLADSVFDFRGTS